MKAVVYMIEWCDHGVLDDEFQAVNIMIWINWLWRWIIFWKYGSFVQIEQGEYLSWLFMACKNFLIDSIRSETRSCFCWDCKIGNSFKFIKKSMLTVLSLHQTSCCCISQQPRNQKLGLRLSWYHRTAYVDTILLACLCILWSPTLKLFSYTPTTEDMLHQEWGLCLT